MFKKIIWATDGSAAADEALPFVKELASAGGGSVTIVHSEEFLAGPGGRGAPLYVDEPETVAKIQRQADELTGAGVQATTKVVGGPSVIGPAHRIADVAAQEQADLIVVGTRGHTPLGGLLLGSVTQRLLHLAPCPVLAVPTRKHAGDRAEPLASANDRAAVLAARAPRRVTGSAARTTVPPLLDEAISSEPSTLPSGLPAAATYTPGTLRVPCGQTR